MQLCATDTRTVVHALKSPGPAPAVSQTDPDVIIMHSLRAVSHSAFVGASRPARTHVPVARFWKASWFIVQKSVFSESVRSLSFLSGPPPEEPLSEPHAPRASGTTKTRKDVLRIA